MNDRHLIELIDVSKAYGGDVALSHVNLYVKDGEFLTLLGPSGCGKTTMLRLIAGFIMPDEGRIEMDGVDIANVPPYRRKINTVFQKYALFPHLNVFDNIAFGLKIRGVDRNTIRKKVEAMLELVNLKGYGGRYVEQLSGGQQQRVAIARALVNEPQVLLLDEPLGALDLKLRKEMQVELKNMQQRLGITFLYVTHDQEEALTMSDTIVVLKDGVIQQVGTPTDVYNEPKNPFVADFIGESNIIPVIMLDDFKVRMNGVVYACVDKGFGRNAEVDVVVRPEDVDIVPAKGARVSGTVVSVVFMGVHYEVDVDCGGYEWVIQTTDYVARGETVGISIPPDAIHVMKKTKQTNLFDGTAYPDDGEVEFCGRRFRCEGLEGFEQRAEVLVAVAPADVRLIAPQDAELTGFVKACMFLGTHYEVTIVCGEEDWIAYADDYMETGEEIGLSVPADRIGVSGT